MAILVTAKLDYQTVFDRLILYKKLSIIKNLRPSFLIFKDQKPFKIKRWTIKNRLVKTVKTLKKLGDDLL